MPICLYLVTTATDTDPDRLHFKHLVVAPEGKAEEVYLKSNYVTLEEVIVGVDLLAIPRGVRYIGSHVPGTPFVAEL
jgi:hypothetical protein